MIKNFLEKCICNLFIKNFNEQVVFKIEVFFRWFLYRSLFHALVKQYRINVILDIGANEGQFAKSIRNIFNGTIHSFEPVTKTFNLLEANAKVDKKWYLHHFALGNENTKNTIFLSDHSVFNSLLKTNAYCKQQFGESSIGKKEEVITIKRLDSVLKDLIPDIENKRILLKMDTQGFDTNVFEGLGDYLQYVHVIQTELSLISIYDGVDHWTQHISTFENKGFRISGLFPVNRDQEQVIEYDCLMTKK